MYTDKYTCICTTLYIVSYLKQIVDYVSKLMTGTKVFVFADYSPWNRGNSINGRAMCHIVTVYTLCIHKRVIR